MNALPWTDLTADDEERLWLLEDIDARVVSMRRSMNEFLQYDPQLLLTELYSLHEMVQGMTPPELTEMGPAAPPRQIYSAADAEDGAVSADDVSGEDEDIFSLDLDGLFIGQEDGDFALGPVKAGMSLIGQGSSHRSSSSSFHPRSIPVVPNLGEWAPLTHDDGAGASDVYVTAPRCPWSELHESNSSAHSSSPGETSSTPSSTGSSSRHGKKKKGGLNKRSTKTFLFAQPTSF